MEINQAIHCLKNDYDEEVCEDCDFYHNCTHETRADMARIAVSALEKQIPMKIVHNPEAGRDADWTCPACKWTCSPYVRHCQNCGQALYNEEYGKD